MENKKLLSTLWTGALIMLLGLSSPTYAHPKLQAHLNAAQIAAFEEFRLSRVSVRDAVRTLCDLGLNINYPLPHTYAITPIIKAFEIYNDEMVNKVLREAVDAEQILITHACSIHKVKATAADGKALDAYRSIHVWDEPRFHLIKYHIPDLSRSTFLSIECPSNEFEDIRGALDAFHGCFQSLIDNGSLVELNKENVLMQALDTIIFPAAGAGAAAAFLDVESDEESATTTGK